MTLHQRWRASAAATAAAGVTGLLALASAAPDVPRPAVTTMAASPAAARTSASLPRPLVVDRGDCGDHSAYEIDEADLGGVQGAHSWYVEAGTALTGGVVSLTFARDDTDVAALDDASVTAKVVMFPDGTGLVDWRRDGLPVALLSGRRVTESQLRTLAAAIADDAVAASGFDEVDAPMTGPRVYGHSCYVNDDFVGVEVVVGDYAAQVAYIGSTDPSDVDLHDDHAVVKFNRHDPNGAVPVRGVDDKAWQRMRDESSARGTDRR